MNELEKQAETDFKDWLGWSGERPNKDDPDFYEYNWGLNVWINAMKYYSQNKK